jgi:hypothetical protein
VLLPENLGSVRPSPTRYALTEADRYLEVLAGWNLRRFWAREPAPKTFQPDISAKTSSSNNRISVLRIPERHRGERAGNRQRSRGTEADAVVCEGACDHLTYFTTQAGLAELA